MAQHSHFHLPGESVARRDPCLRPKPWLHCNSPVGLAVELCLEVVGDCLGSVEERIDQLVQRIGTAAHIG